MINNTTRYYLNIRNGKIKTGKQLIENNTVERILVDFHLVQIDPYATYRDKQNKTYTGKELIALKKISMDLFDESMLIREARNHPY